MSAPVTLGVDQGRTSGFAILAGDELVTSGVAKSARQRRLIVGKAISLARESNTDLLFVYEDHGGIPARRKGNTRTILGMGAARGRWEEQLDMAGHPKAKRVKVRPETWRANVLGLRLFTPRDEAKAAAVDFVAVHYNVQANDDEAEAICIGRYGMEHTKLGKAA